MKVLYHGEADQQFVIKRAVLHLRVRQFLRKERHRVTDAIKKLLKLTTDALSEASTEMLVLVSQPGCWRRVAAPRADLEVKKAN